METKFFRKIEFLRAILPFHDRRKGLGASENRASLGGPIWDSEEAGLSSQRMVASPSGYAGYGAEQDTVSGSCSCHQFSNTQRVWAWNDMGYCNCRHGKLILGKSQERRINEAVTDWLPMATNPQQKRACVSDTDFSAVKHCCLNAILQKLLQHRYDRPTKSFQRWAHMCGQWACLLQFWTSDSRRDQGLSLPLF